MLESLEGSKDYQNQQEAQAAYAKADTAKKEKDVLVMRAEERLQKAQEQENRAQTLIAKYKKEIPQQMEEQKIRQQAYREILEEKHFPETAWMELTGTYTKTQVQKWKQDAQNHGRQKAAAESLINSARAAIGEQPKPVLEELEKTSEAAEAAWKESQRVLEQWQEIWRIDQKVCQALKWISKHMYKGIIWSRSWKRQTRDFRTCPQDSLNCGCAILTKPEQAKTEVWI